MLSSVTRKILGSAPYPSAPSDHSLWGSPISWQRLRACLVIAAVASLWVASSLSAQFDPEDLMAPDPVPEAAAEDSEADLTVGGWALSWGIDAKVHFRSSDQQRFVNPFPFPPTSLPPGQDVGFLETVNEGEHFEVGVISLVLDAKLEDAIQAHAKIDFIDLYDRNPTSGDRTVDVDELWIRFGRESLPAIPATRSGVYLKVGKFAHFERQNDRHLESYGLISTAFNRFEDMGVELGADLGPHFYVKVSATAGNPVFFRDTNALAGDNGTDEFLQPFPDPELKSGFVILYDAETEDIDTDGDLELGAGLGVRFGDGSGRRGVDLLVWGYRRTLADRVPLNGTFYGGDLDLLLGPGNAYSLGVQGDEKEEFGANLWWYRDGFSLFAQFVDQELAGLERDGFEVEVAHRFDLPLRYALAGRQLFSYIQPAIRYSSLDPGPLGGSPAFPAPSVRWDWEKIDYGLRMGIYSGIDLTVEYSDNTFTLLNGRELGIDEFLTTLRWKL
ncbi:MAG: hypothetical protein AAGD01_07485 [Acidobacteriota bacterium]